MSIMDDGDGSGSSEEDEVVAAMSIWEATDEVASRSQNHQ